MIVIGMIVIGTVPLVGTGCVAGAPAGGPPTTPPASAPSSTPSNGLSPSPSAGPASGRTEVKITYDDGAGETQTWRLTCHPPGGDHPVPAAACRALTANGSVALAPVAPTTACTEQYGGPQRARISGRWRGEPVTASLSRINGCEISRWNQLVPLLPRGGV